MSAHHGGEGAHVGVLHDCLAGLWRVAGFSDLRDDGSFHPVVAMYGEQDFETGKRV